MESNYDVTVWLENCTGSFIEHAHVHWVQPHYSSDDTGQSFRSGAFSNLHDQCSASKDLNGSTLPVKHGYTGWSVSVEIGGVRYYTTSFVGFWVYHRAEQVIVQVFARGGGLWASVGNRMNGQKFATDKIEVLLDAYEPVTQPRDTFRASRIPTPAMVATAVRQALDRQTNAKRPFFVIAHKCNYESELRSAITSGANMIEIDLFHGYHTVLDSAAVHWLPHFRFTSFAMNAARKVFTEPERKWYVRHPGVGELIKIYPESFSDPSCFDIEQWIKAFKEATKNRPDQVLAIIFDLKHYDANHIKELYNIARYKLPDNVAIILSTSSIEEAKSMITLKDIIINNDGFAVDYESKPDDVEFFFANTSIDRFWYADGITQHMPEWFVNAKEGISRSTEIRNARASLTKSYIWSYSDIDKIKKLVGFRGGDNRHAIDAIMVEFEQAKETIELVKSNPKLTLATDPKDLWRAYPD